MGMNGRTFCVTSLVFVLLLVAMSGLSSAQQTAVYPRVTGYFSITHPIATWDKHGIKTNFSDSYTVIFPFGINLLKSDRFGFSFEVSPAIRSDKNGAKVSSVLFHPGAMFRFDKGFTVNGRLAFDTNGRFGFTPVLSQVVKRYDSYSYSVSVPFPVRLGNNQPASLGVGLQFGIGF